ncbi:hypothetical protein MPTK1_3g16530 [Marchantia polymorpha subsp. ruderalis]|uniref:Uncharacterized protein n=2 Tax=Marchantia polymorpha TaxID=3197 RepID=A0A176VQD3_MARPO|nr:hypothetical protein AXG93_3271s1180 [Marchantia polymorpha subsp. ruderalis]PTQ48717.1 hypothetical protein MARPO_0004s0018 [Marchantia polymorpha]BBN05860.1 hypothetical protein Mp_3g16530 [Marchantia polymorpha subsp. ruderalis]|eukprot:PTQ48717.1 hypothetical protein MARPO_0004s0018 [Marchantia polymorpha]
MAALDGFMLVAVVAIVLTTKALGQPELELDHIVVSPNVPGEPERGNCVLPGKCYGKNLRCPKDCPSRRTEAPGKSACFMDCYKNCEATCKHRKANCYGYGAVCYDPRFIGGDGVMFYFHGQKDQHYCIVSDRRLHINAHFIGKRPLGRPRDYTWVQSLGFMFENHRFGVGARKAAVWDDNVDHLELTYDNTSIDLIDHEGALWVSPSGDVVVERIGRTNSILVMIDQLMEVILEAVPIEDYESRIHNYEITEDDCFAHLQMQFTFYSLSSSVHGVLGQTYQPGFQTPVNQNVPIHVMGREQAYLSSSLFLSDCRVSQFLGGAPLDSTDPDPVQPEVEPWELFQIKCQSSGDGGVQCRRRR